MNAESIIFDLDGTLWDSSESVAESWNMVLDKIENPKLKGFRFTENILKSGMGMQMNQLAGFFFPELDEKERIDILDRCIKFENEYVSVHGGIIFENEEKILKELSANHRLFIVSNCQCGYIEAFLNFSGFGSYFTDYMCWGDTQKHKSYTIGAIMDKHKCTNAVYVGDTLGDCEAAHGAGIPFIHASYGFGKNIPPELVAAEIKSIEDLVKLFT